MPEKTLSEFTDEDEFEYEFFDVQQEAARKKKDLDRLNLLSNRQLAEMIDAERAKTDKLGGGIYSVVTGKSYQRSTPTTSYDAAKMRGAAAQSPNVSSIEIQEIWKRWYELDKKGQAPSSDAEVDAFIEAVNPSDKGWDFIQNKLFPEYDLEWGIINVIGCETSDCFLENTIVGNSSVHKLNESNGTYYYPYQHSSSFYINRDSNFQVGFGLVGTHTMKLLVTSEFVLDSTLQQSQTTSKQNK